MSSTDRVLVLKVRDTVIESHWLLIIERGGGVETRAWMPAPGLKVQVMIQGKQG